MEEILSPKLVGHSYGEQSVGWVVDEQYLLHHASCKKVFLAFFVRRN